jgi:hypothetical protein
MLDGSGHRNARCSRKAANLASSTIKDMKVLLHNG